jgi:hypothetical protein
MILRGATSLLGALEGVGPENSPHNDVAPLKIIKYKRHKNNRYINS